MDLVLFSTISLAWFLIHTQHFSWTKSILTLLVIVCIPFVHLRGVMPAVFLFLIFIINQIHFFHSSMGKIRFVSIVLGIAFLAGIAFIGFNLSVYQGNIMGAANGGSPTISLDALNATFFNFRHGLFTYSPIYLFSLVGLLLNTAKNRLGFEATGLFLFALLPAIHHDMGESWPSRYTLASVPALIIGFCFWLNTKPSCLEKTIATVLATVSFANTFLFTVYPNIFLESRFTQVTYPFMLNFLRNLHPESLLQGKLLLLITLVLVVMFTLYHLLKRVKISKI